MKRILGLSVFIGFLLCRLVSIADAQEKLRIIRETVLDSSPVIVVSRQVGDKPVDRKHKNRHGIIAGSNWLKQLVFDVKNVSNKNITYISLELVIPKTGKMEHNGRVVRFVFGNRVASAATANRDSSHPLELLKPADVVKLKINDSERTSLETYLNKYEVQEVENITIDIREVHFDDGTGWSLGIELRQDPLAPQNWNPLIRGQTKNQRSSSFWIASLVPPRIFDFFGSHSSLSIPAQCRNFFCFDAVSFTGSTGVRL